MRLSLSLAVLALAVIGGAVSPAAQAQRNCICAVGSHQLPKDRASPAFIFGGHPIIPLSFRVTVYRDGRIARKGRFPNSVRETVNASLPALLKLAEAEGFFCLPADIKGHRRNVDNGPVFITVYTGNGKKTVTLEPTGRNQRFSELYSVLMDLVSRGSG